MRKVRYITRELNYKVLTVKVFNIEKNDVEEVKVNYFGTAGELGIDSKELKELVSPNIPVAIVGVERVKKEYKMTLDNFIKNAKKEEADETKAEEV